MVRNYGSARCRSDSLQIVRRELACPSIGNNVESDLLSLVEGTHASTFNRADVHKDILAAIIRLDKAETFLAIEELHGPLRHIASSFRYVCNEAAHLRSRFVRGLEKGRQSDAGGCGEAKSFGRSSRASYGASRLNHKVYSARDLRKGWLFGRPNPISM